jgi:hypothetical protein
MYAAYQNLIDFRTLPKFAATPPRREAAADECPNVAFHHSTTSRTVMKDMSVSAAPTLLSSGMQACELHQQQERDPCFRVVLELGM